MFAALIFDREPLVLNWGNLPVLLNTWVQTVGGFAAVGLLLGLVGYAMLPKGRRGRSHPLRTALVSGAAVLSGLCYLVLAGLYVPDLLTGLPQQEEVAPAVTGWRWLAQQIGWTCGGACAIVAVLTPMLADLPLFRWRRVWAIAWLTFKEAIRRKFLWVFLALLLVVLFGSWFISSKPEDQVRSYVQVVSVAKHLLLVLAALLLACFAIPDDIRNQTIHTVLTKPVQRFELFLGRFVGLTVLLTLVLLVISVASPIYVLRGVDQDAAEESLKARVPIYGDLHFEGTKEGTKRGVNVGREWDYRSYIYGPAPNQPTQYAVWGFLNLPTGVDNRERVRCEFTLDIYRMTKGEEGKGVYCTFEFESWRFDARNPALKAQYDKARQLGQGDPNILDKLAEEYGYYEVRAKEIKDYHTQYLDIPAGLFRNALLSEASLRAALARVGKTRPEDVAPQEIDRLRREQQEQRRSLEDKQGSTLPPVQVRVKCDSRTQFVGMAKYDLFLRQDDPEGSNDRLWFSLNFLKGVSFSVWLQLCLVTGLGITLSTYLSGVITLLATIMLYISGFFQDFIQEVAGRRNIGGGPIESALRLVRKPGGESIAVPLEETTAVQVSTWLDNVFRWLLQRVLEIIPDVNRFNFTDFVAEGVSVSGAQMLTSLLLLFSYLLPWAVLAYYLLKWREVAGNQ
jgi:hypothetical protein